MINIRFSNKLSTIRDSINDYPPTSTLPLACPSCLDIVYFKLKAIPFEMTYVE